MIDETFAELFGINISELQDHHQYQKIKTYLLNSYTEHFRVYHACQHPVYMILKLYELLEDHPDLSEKVNLLALKLMIIYHDVIFKLMRELGWSEKKSAEKAFRDIHLTLRMPAKFADIVQTGILATARHKMPLKTNDLNPISRRTIALLLDLDLMGFGNSWSKFKEDTKDNWCEWQSIKTEQEFHKNRGVWARKFLKDHLKIYNTEYFANKEEQAQKNLSRLAKI
ncbi:hypothetical protein KC723_01930 [Candidatus Kaiserbacteria bacterium]|nr:hypothetical protein [Candidatus Kaiserbacteria bacterium]